MSIMQVPYHASDSWACGRANTFRMSGIEHVGHNVYCACHSNRNRLLQPYDPSIAHTFSLGVHSTPQRYTPLILHDISAKERSRARMQLSVLHLVQVLVRGRLDDCLAPG